MLHLFGLVKAETGAGGISVVYMAAVKQLFEEFTIGCHATFQKVYNFLEIFIFVTTPL